MRCAVVVEKAEGNLTACVPELRGYVATSSIADEVESQIREAIEFHIEGMREDGTPIPRRPAASNTSTFQRNAALKLEDQSGIGLTLSGDSGNARFSREAISRRDSQRNVDLK